MCVESLPLTGERTVPGIPAERYWYFRHEAVYRWLIGQLPTRDAGAPHWLLDAGCGEGYGAHMLTSATEAVVALDYDEVAITHVARSYPDLAAVRGNLAGLPFASAAFSAVVSLQVIEHMWDLAGFLRECRRVVQPGGLVAVSTPNRPVFSPGLPRGVKPTNPFHVEEFDAAQVVDLLTAAGLAEVELAGLHHGPRIVAWEQEHGSIVAAHVKQVRADAPNQDLAEFVASIEVADFVIGDTEGSHDLIGLARR